MSTFPCHAMKFRHAGPTPLLLDLMQPPPLPRMHRLHIYITQFIPQPRPSAPHTPPSTPLTDSFSPRNHSSRPRYPRPPTAPRAPNRSSPTTPAGSPLAADAPVQQPDVLPGVDAQQRRGVDAAGRRGHLGPGGGRELAERAGRVLHLRLLRQRRGRPCPGWAPRRSRPCRRATARSARSCPGPAAGSARLTAASPRGTSSGCGRSGASCVGTGSDEPDEARAEHGEHGGEGGFFEGGYGGEVALWRAEEGGGRL